MDWGNMHICSYIIANYIVLIASGAITPTPAPIYPDAIAEGAGQQTQVDFYFGASPPPGALHRNTIILFVSFFKAHKYARSIALNWHITSKEVDGGIALAFT